MLTKAIRLGRTPGSWSTTGRLTAAGLIVALGATLSGCAAEADADAGSAPIELVTAYISAPHGTDPTDAYIAIRNNAGADKLVSVRTSVGGTVTMRALSRRDGVPTVRAVSSIPIPAHSFVRLNPDGEHLVITGAGRMKAGTEITMTLVFAHDGSYQIPAEVTNPQTGGASYFLN